MPRMSITESHDADVQVIRNYSAKNLLCHIELSEVGRGSFGTVLHAKHAILGNVAVKCVTITGGERQQSTLEKKLLKEYNKLQECRHPNIVIVFGITKWPGAMGILMEYCEGGNLRDLLLDDSIDVGLVLLLRINLDIAAGVAHLHNCGLNVRVIHGDLKPENILLTVMLVCKITDLGSAQMASYTGSTTMEAGREKIGLTLYYAAPEKLLHGARPKKEQDAYSCGVIHHMTLSREEPYQSQIEFQRKLEQGLRPNCQAIQELKEESRGNNREIVEVIEGAMVRCWDQDPSHRPNMITIRDEFQAIMAKQDPAVIAQQVTDAVRGMNIQHPPQNPTAPLHQFSTENRRFLSEGTALNPHNFFEVQLQQQIENLASSSDDTSPKLPVDVTHLHRPSEDVSEIEDRMQDPSQKQVTSMASSSDVTSSKLLMDVRLPGDETEDQMQGPSQKQGFLVIGGYDSERVCVKWNVNTKQHQHLPKLNTARKFLTSARVNNNVYVMGGLGPIKSCEMMDLNENKRWIKIADLPQTRSGAASSVVQDRVHLSGGQSGSCPLSSCLIYDDVINTWMNSFNMLQPRHGHGMCSINSSICCIAGFDGKQILKSCEHRDVRSSTSSNIASLNEARSRFACVETGGKIYAIGGWNGRYNLKTVEEYEPRTNKWRNVSPLIIHRSLHSACVVHGRIYVVGGTPGLLSFPVARNCFKSVEVYNPSVGLSTHCFDLDQPVVSGTVVAV